MKIFTKNNELLTAFYLMDICKEKCLNNESKIKEELKKYLPDIDNLEYIHKNYFNTDKLKIKLIFNNKLHQIEEVNFSIYFLTKSFLYLKNKKYNEKFNKFFMEKFLPILSNNIVTLYNKRKNFYGNKSCHKFPLYSKTKNYIETYIIPNPKFDNYKTFFNIDMPSFLKEEFNISYCYSSRLLNQEYKKKLSKENKKKEILIIDSISLNEVLMNNNLNDSFFSSEATTRTASENSISFIQNKNITNLNNLRNNSSNLFEINSCKSLDFSKLLEKEEKDYFHSFKLIENKNNIYSPKNYFFKIIFAEIYKNLIYNDKTFKLIKSSYFLKFRKFNNLNR